MKFGRDEKKSSIQDIRSIKVFSTDNDDECSSDDERNSIADIACLPEISAVKRKEDRCYQHLLPIDNGLYDGTVSEKFLREGLGTYTVNNDEEYYSGAWKDDKPHGYGYNLKSRGSTIYYGEFNNGLLKEGYGKVTLEDGYVYKGPIKDGKFHGLGSLSMKIAGLKEIDTLQLVAEWENGKTSIVYKNEIKLYYEYQYQAFCNSLESIISLNSVSRKEQRKFFQSLIDLLEKRLLNLNLLNEIATHSILPRELKSSANLLYKLDNSYTHLKKYTEIDIKNSYNNCVKNICEIGLKIYATSLAWTEDDEKLDCISSRKIFDENLNSFTQKSQLSDLKAVLLIDTFVVDLIQKMIRFANEKLLRISSQYRSEFIDSHTRFIKRIWLDYFQALEKDSIANSLDDEIDKRYHFYTDCYSNLLEIPLVSTLEAEPNKLNTDQNNSDLVAEENNMKYEIKSIIYKAMKFSLDQLKPWRNLPINELTSYFKQSIHHDTSIKEIGDKLLIQILQDIERKMVDFFKMNTKHFSDILQSIVSYYQNNLLNDTNLNYQSKMKEIIRIVDYLLQISGTKNSHIKELTDAQLESIKTFIERKENVTEFVDHFLNFNVELCNLSQHFDNQFSVSIHSEFNRNASDIISSIKYIFKILLPNESNMRSEILSKYDVSDVDVALRQAVFKERIFDVEVLLELGANVNAPGPSSGKTALHWAVISKDKHLVSRLLEKGGDITIEDHEQKSSLDYAKTNGIDLISLLDEMKNEKTENSSNKPYALQKINNFLTNLGSLDFTWFVERKKITNLDTNLFKPAGEKGLYKVTNIEKAKKKVKDPCRHYMFDTINELLDIVKNVKIFNRSSPTEIVKVRAEMLMAIGKSFKYFNDQIKYSSLEKFKDDCVIPFRDVMSDSDSYETFYSKLEKIDLYFLYDRKLKEITIDQALELFKEKNGNFSKLKIIKNSFYKYEKVFKKYFYDIIDKKKSIEEITTEARKNANELNFNIENIPDIIAGLAVILSLSVSDFIEKNHQGEYVLKEKYNKKYLLQPHCIQILGVLMLLDIDGKTNTISSKHLAEILTGQGKSWTLALLAGFFSLVGCQVTVGCYNDYLSRRDEGDFKKYLDPFKFTNNVKYRTFESMCEEKLTSKKHNKKFRDIIFDILSGEHLSPEYSQENENEKSILLIDEVDVFFSHNFGAMYCPGLRIKNKCFVEMQKDIWENIMMSKVVDKNQLKTLANQRIFNSTSQDKMLSHLVESNLLEDHLENMINTALRIREDMRNRNELRDKYRIIDNIIHTKDNDGKFVSTTWYDYEDSFYYLKLMYEKQKSFKQVHLDEDNFGYLSIRCGLISYSELPNSYDGIFGVSGSLKALSAGEESLLIYYNIHKRSYYPSFFGGSKLKFSIPNDFVIKDCKNDWFDSIVTRVRRRIAEDRSVLIFFYNEKLLDEFFTFYSGDLRVVPFYITQNKIFDGHKDRVYSDIYVDKLIKDEYAGHHGKVTLLTRVFGRGVDFQAEAKVNEKGGIHVIQTFFSMNVKEEIQIKGRTARKDDPGSYELVLCREHLEEPDSVGMKTSKFVNITKETTYDELDKQRTEIVDLFCRDKLKNIQANKNRHELTVSFFERAITECNENNRQDFIKEIKTL
ncbi:unnamed protein product [Rotaria socialis]|uniref:SecA family profile domain-containing protein n=2 Tax=Rotaria socialis TaxID=392032 RepID=A0A817TB94_9BILA|nr:unnamed protein product [Rotaria socialis]CAF4350557.1 unnamed protein product [Rotaria socialis]